MGGVIARAKKIIVPTSAVKNDILTAYPTADASKIIPIHEAVDPFFLTSKTYRALPKPRAKEGNLLFVGNAYPHKNLKNLLAAFTLLRREGDYRLTLLSKNTPFLHNVLKELNPVDRPFVKIDENITDKALLKHYQEAGVLVVPTFMEGFGLPALEALAVGTPVVASNIPVFKEVYGKHVTYCNPFDALSIQDQIKKVLVSPRPAPYLYPRSWVDVAADIKKVLL
jgi:glycosyltransferase involved in cell wall biosynthesis